MIRKNFTPEQIINKLREAEVHISQGSLSLKPAERERIFNTPHQVLVYITLLKFPEQWKENQGKRVMCR